MHYYFFTNYYIFIDILERGRSTKGNLKKTTGTPEQLRRREKDREIKRFDSSLKGFKTLRLQFQRKACHISVYLEEKWRYRRFQPEICGQ